MKAWRLLGRRNGGRSTRRTRGRHSEGYRSPAVSRRVFDPAARAQAAQLDQLEPGWLIWYAVYDRLYYAISHTGITTPACVAGPTPDALCALMREAESMTRIGWVA
ncbi:hypothetical protein Sme01_54140 [Sphaerisporangium melleum]|uniref:Uncharacterized protein n=1 Tax=Sphaerisporangium melleum TaxID=321316 RepID=A0A917VJY7_9ACTN|nr:hypothetical protein GCM10007964_38000 [Sphaerisporangium melleum]GII72938.1 hypothetical protein Sme01_54140 [Sphaerisporangium melleum]